MTIEVAAGGAAVPVTKVTRPLERGHLWPAFLPDGRHFLYMADSAQNEGHGVYVSALDAPTPKRLLDDASNVAYTADGYLLFARERRLIAQGGVEVDEEKRTDPNATVALEPGRQYRLRIGRRKFAVAEFRLS